MRGLTEAALRETLSTSSLRDIILLGYRIGHASVQYHKIFWENSPSLSHKKLLLFLLRDQPFTQGIWPLFNQIRPHYCALVKLLEPKEAAYLIQFTNNEAGLSRDIMHIYFQIYSKEDFTEMSKYIASWDKTLYETLMKIAQSSRISEQTSEHIYCSKRKLEDDILNGFSQKDQKYRKTTQSLDQLDLDYIMDTRGGCMDAGMNI
jgi:hypothetical protein